MGILIDSKTRAIVQGITGKQGSYHTKLMLDYGAKILAGVSPGKGGMTIDGLPVFDTVKETLDSYSPNASIIFVPANFAQDAVLEAIENKIKTIVVITEHIPIRDSINVIANAAQAQVSVIGPNTPGIITPGECKLGIMPTSIFTPGNVGLVSRSGTLAYEVAAGLRAKGLGESTCVGVGGDPVVGLNFIEALELFKDDAKTKAVVLIG
jgi:succinyl-CoA synthetase alpha subunit